MSAEAHTKSRLISVPRGTISDSRDMDFHKNPVALREARTHAKAKLEDNLKNGDVVQFLDVGHGYRNNGRLIYYGGEYLILANSNYINEYGYVPENIKINQFNCVDFFADSIMNNSVIWHDHTKYPVVREVLLPSDIANAPELGQFRLVYFSNGWSLITNKADIRGCHYTFRSDYEINTDELPAGVNQHRLMYLLEEPEHPGSYEEDDYIPEEAYAGRTLHSEDMEHEEEYVPEEGGFDDGGAYSEEY